MEFQIKKKKIDTSSHLINNFIGFLKTERILKKLNFHKININNYNNCQQLTVIDKIY